MQKSLLTLFCTICALFFIPVSVQATDYLVEPTTAIKSNTIPYFRNSNGMKGSVTQQIYLPSEFAPSGASAGNITDITFYYASKDGSVYSPNTANECTRQVEIYLMETSVESYTLEYVDNTWKSKFLCNGSNKAGTKVYDGNLTTNQVTYTDPQQSVTLHLDAPFAWDGVSNIVLTLYDKSSTPISENTYNNLKFYITETSHARFVHCRWLSGSDDDRSSWISNINRYGDTYGNPSVKDSAGWAGKRVFVPKTTFSITAIIPAPTNLAASSITTSSATLSWDAVDGAASYNVRWGKTSGSLDNSDNVATNSIDISGLDDGETYYFDVQTVKAAGTSAYASEANFNTTAIAHIHDGITFSKWTSTTSLPSEAGNYYLNGDVVLAGNYSVSSKINLCLNGHNIYTDNHNIVVSDDTLTIYDNVGGGRIYGYYVGDNSSYYGLVSVDIDGTFVLNGGSVENLADDFNDAGEVSYGIYNNGTLLLSGAPAIIGFHGDIYLASSKYITIKSGKPLTNTTPYSLFKLTIGPFTIGWSNMSGAKPSAHFTPKNEFHGVCYNSSTGEAEVVRVFSTSDNNASIKTALEDGTYRGTLLNFNITSRSFTSESFNTICLPFALSNAQLEDVFGAGYDLEEFVSSSLGGDVLALEFNKVTSLVAGKPYLLQPSVDVANPVFDGVTFYISEPVDQEDDTYISFHGTFGPTSLTGGNKNLLFLGADNELFWPDATGNLKGFRAYFEVKGGAALAAKRARIVKKEDSATGIETVESRKTTVESSKVLRNGQLLILRDNKTYNVIGQMVK